jgi:hypothetical protein
LQLLTLNRYCGQAEAIHLDEKRWSLPDKCWNQRLDATDSSPTHSDNRGGFPNRRRVEQFSQMKSHSQKPTFSEQPDIGRKMGRSIFPPAGKPGSPGRPQLKTTLTEMDPTQQALFRLFALDRYRNY